MSGPISLSIPPDTWGPFFWHTFHLLALGYSNNPSYSDKKAAKDFFESMTFLSLSAAISKCLEMMFLLHFEQRIG